MSITKNLEDTLKVKIYEISNGMDSDDFNGLMQWVFDEYKNCMIIGRETFEETLDNILSGDYPDKAIFKLLKDNINSYGAPKAYLNVSRWYLNKASSIKGGE